MSGVKNLKVKIRISRVLMAVLAGILLLLAGIRLGKKVPEELWMKIGVVFSDAAVEHAKKWWLPGLACAEAGEEKTPWEWVADRATELLPIGTYVEDKEFLDTEVEDRETYAMILARQESDENAVDEEGKLIGEEKPLDTAVQTSGTPIDASMEKLMNYEYLLGNFYAVDGNTMADPQLLNAKTLLEKDLHIEIPDQEEPKVLIYHTHSQEAFADSAPGDSATSIVGMGAYLTQLLSETYKIPTLHHEGVYDLVDGKLDRSQAYQLAEPEIQKILAEHPSIEVVIDLHRDGVAEGTHLVTEVGGKPTAQIMFFNGLSRTKANGNISYLPNPYIEDNLAFSLQLQLAANEKYPGFTRRIFLRGYRYNMHFKPRTLLIEAGAQTNTVEEMRNAMEVLADTLAHVLIK